MTYDKNRDGMFWQPLWDLAFIVLAVMPITSMEQRSFSYYRIDWWVVEQDKEDCPAVQHIAWFFFFSLPVHSWYYHVFIYPTECKIRLF